MLTAPLRYFIFLFLFPGFLLVGQDDSDTVRYRSTSFQCSASHFALLGAKYPQYGSFFPGAALCLKSARTDSTYTPLKNINFMITLGAAASRYLFSDAEFFTHFLLKDPVPVFSKRFWGGFGINYRRSISPRLTFDLDVSPCIQIIVDKAEEGRVDTAFWETRVFTEIYQGLLLYANCKVEYKTSGRFAPYFTFAASAPLINDLAADRDEQYHDRFKAQLFIGAGLTYYYKSRRRIEPGEKARGKQ